MTMRSGCSAAASQHRARVLPSAKSTSHNAALRTIALGAYHTAELAYLFPGFHGGEAGVSTVLNPLQERLASTMVRYWSRPRDAAQWRDWPLYDPQQDNVLSLALPQTRVLPAGQFAQRHQCRFWEDTLGVYR